MKIKIITLLNMITCITGINAQNRDFHIKKGQLGVYQLMIASKYFETINDFQNLELATPKAYGNMTKFHFNPIALTEDTIKFFPNLETLHLYNKKDEHFKETNFFKRVIWYETSIYDFVHNNDPNVIFKNFKISNACIEYVFFGANKNRVIISPDNIQTNGLSIALDKAAQDISVSTKIMRICKQAFEYCNDIRNVNIPDSTTHIGAEAFSNCYALKSIAIPASISKISSGTFSKCYSLSAIHIPQSVQIIKKSAFSMCTSLKELHIPNSVTSLGNNLCYRCQSLTNVSLPNNITSIPKHMFKRCFNLQNILIPKHVVTIHDGCFEDCNCMTSLDVPTSVTKIHKGICTGCFLLEKIIIRRIHCSKTDRNRIKNLINDLIVCGNATVVCEIMPPLKRKYFIKHSY